MHIELAQVLHCSSRFVGPSGKRVACRDDADYHEKGRQIPE